MEKLHALHHDHPVLYRIALTLVLALVSWLALRYISPTPPRTLTISTGAPDGAYQQFALKYQSILKQEGVDLVIKTSSGAIENLSRLNDGSVDVGMVQGGLGILALDPMKDANDTELRSLATIAVEPVWIYSNKLDLSLGLGPLTGKRIAVGLPNSGTNKVAKELLSIFGVLDALGKPVLGTQLVMVGGLAGAKMLQSKEVDAVIIVAAPQSAAVTLLMEDSNVEPASMRLAEGLTRRFAHFQQVSLKQGSINPQRNLPSRDISLIATLANLVVREDLHPALSYLLLDAAHQTHNRPGLLSRPNEFPSALGVDFPLATEAERYFKNGKPFLQRYMPFWLANFVQRLILIAIPVLALLFPLLRVMPSLLIWQQEKKLFRHYGELKFIELDLASRPAGAGPWSEPEVKAMAHKLDQIDEAVRVTKFSLNFTDRVFTLRQHVDYVRAKLRALDRAS